MRKLFFLLTILALIAFGAPHVGAQLDDLKLQYRASLDKYRSSEDQFSIAASQYYNLKTLASQEEAVRAAREVDLARVDTLLIYIQALRTTLDTKNGIELARKNTLQKQFDLLVDNLKRHRARLEIATDRLKIEDENVFMENQAELIQALCYEALSLIKIGAVQAALDQLVITKDGLDQYISTAKISETTRSEKQRGSEELARSIEDVKRNLSLSLTAYDTGLENADSSLFRKVQDTLNPAYTGLTQGQEFVKELAQ